MARQSRRPLILVTRPEPQASRFAAELGRQVGPEGILLSPVLGPVYLPVQVPPRAFTALVLTSETGAEAARRISAAGQTLPDLAYCVGTRTAAVARQAGFRVLSAAGDAAALVSFIQSQHRGGLLLYLHGRDTRGQVAEKLNLAGIETVALLCYAQEALPLTDQAIQAIRRDQPVVLPLFSPRSAEILVRQWAELGAKARPWVVALSPAVADLARGLNPERLIIAAHPDGASLLAALVPLVVAGGGS